MADMTYVVSGRIVLDGEVVPEGTEIPEAAQWKYVDTLVRQGKLAHVPKSAVSEDTEKASSPIPGGLKRESAAGPTEGYDEPPITQEQYNELSIGDVKGMLQSRTLDIGQVDEFESNRERYRQGIKDLVLGVDEADVEPSTDEDEDEDSDEPTTAADEDDEPTGTDEGDEPVKAPVTDEVTGDSEDEGATASEDDDEEQAGEG